VAEEKARTDEGKLLATILEALGVSPKAIKGALSFFESNVDSYRDNPEQLYMLLRAVGVGADKAAFATRRFAEAIGRPLLFGEQQKAAAFTTPQFQLRQMLQDAIYSTLLTMLMDRMMSYSRGGQQNNPNIPPAPQIPHIYSYEPILDKDGNIKRDSSGRPLYRIVSLPYFPSAAPRKESGLKDLIEIFKIVSGIAESASKEAKALLQQRIDELEKRLSSLANRDPFKEAIDYIEKLKKIGLVTTGNIPPEIEKMRLELEKWRTEKELELKKWFEEQRAEREKKAREEERFIRIIDAIRDVGGRVAEQIAKGVGAGLSAGLSQRLSPKQPPSGHVRLSKSGREKIERIKQSLEKRGLELG